MKQNMIEKTKRFFRFVVYSLLPLTGGGWVGVSCSDMLEVDSDLQTFDPSLSSKTDSVFYVLGMLEGMQRLADQQVFLGEMRGDLVTTTEYTDTMLSQLADYTATAVNRYDSAYLYYNVINNCNYYIAHRDTNLYNGGENVAIPEYASVVAMRAWAYLQLVRNYGSVPLVTTPLTMISQIDDNDYPMVDMNGLVNALSGELEKFSGQPTPDFGNITYDIGSANSGRAKTMNTSKLLIPVDVILGDLYLENNQYREAAQKYIKYLTDVCTKTSQRRSAFFSAYSSNTFYDRPGDWAIGYNENVSGASTWSTIFTTNNSVSDVITYIPMAVNRTQGAVTTVPKAFGYNYYATEASSSLNGGLYIDEIQIMPSKAFFAISDSTDYYYYKQASSAGNVKKDVRYARLGDQRARVARLDVGSSGTRTAESGAAVLLQGTGNDSTKIWVRKYENANIILYRTTTVLLHLAEALNRLNMPDAAFAILKEGITSKLLDDDASYYMSETTKQALKNDYPLLSAANAVKFDGLDANNNLSNDCRYGIHMHGAGMTRDFNGTNFVNSPYRLDTIVGVKLRNLAAEFPSVTIGTTLQDSINAMEDILCDEYAMEFAFEGTRYYDLMRLARHKNESSPAGYPANFGYVWLKKKLEGRGWDETKMYLPFN